MRLTLLLLLFAVNLSAAEIKVFAAASLTDALLDAARIYERESKDTVVFNFGASSVLARQIEAGAPADLFLSADEEKMNALQRRGRIDAKTRVSFLSNTLVIVGVREPEALRKVRRIALAEPSTVPAGIYAKQYLQRAGLWRAVAAKVIPTDNVRAALAAYESGNVDAAIVYATDLRVAKRLRATYRVPREEGPRISYPFAVVSDSSEKQAAKRFLTWLRQRTDIFSKHGFLVP